MMEAENELPLFESPAAATDTHIPTGIIPGLDWEENSPGPAAAAAADQKKKRESVASPPSQSRTGPPLSVLSV